MKKIFKGFDYEKLPPQIRHFVNVCVGFHFFRDPYKKMKIIGVTGTNGKTTTATLLYKIAMALRHKAGLVGTIENLVAGRKILTDFTTPESMELNKILSEMNKAGCEYVFMEVSSHGMKEKRVAGINFAGGIFTNLTQDHLDYHKNMENYFKAKKNFFEILPEKSFALSNIDDPHGGMMLEATKAKKFSYGFENNSDFRGNISRLDFSGLEIDFNGENIKSKMLGRFNAYNLLAVWSTCKILDFDMKKVKKILENVEPPRGRFDYFKSASGILVIVDYAHTPDALEKVLSTTREIKSKESRIISVFGCGGDRDQLKRPIMGKIGASLSDIAIFTSDNPRNEDPDKIIRQMKTDLSEEELKKVRTISNRREAIKEAVKLAKAGDVILCAGKGHEDYQEIKGVKYHFNDLEELKNSFKQK